MTGERTREGFYKVNGDAESRIKPSLAYALKVDPLWFGTTKADIEEAIILI